MSPISFLPITQPGLRVPLRPSPSSAWIQTHYRQLVSPGVPIYLPCHGPNFLTQTWPGDFPARGALLTLVSAGNAFTPGLSSPATVSLPTMADAALFPGHRKPSWEGALAPVCPIKKRGCERGVESRRLSLARMSLGDSERYGQMAL